MGTEAKDGSHPGFLAHMPAVHPTSHQVPLLMRNPSGSHRHSCDEHIAQDEVKPCPSTS